MTKKNDAKKAQVENVNVVANNTEVEAQSQEVAKKAEAAKKAKAAKKAEAAEKQSNDLKARADALIAEAKRLKDEAKQAAKEAKEAAKKAKALTSRPMRKFYFETTTNGELVMKSDVHYCAEKAAIDALTELRNQEGEESSPIYEIRKVYKDPSQEEGSMLIEKLYLNEEKQIVIE